MTKKRKTKPRGESLMNRTRAVVALCNSTRDNADMKMAAFLDLFHPRMDKHKRHALVYDARQRR